MRRSHTVALMAFIIAVPAAAAGSLLAPSSSKPCFIAGNATYAFSGARSATHIVRIDNKTANPSLRIQLVDDPAQADFVLVDDTDAGRGCTNETVIESIRIDAAAVHPDLTVTLSRAAADHKIYVQSSSYTEQDAAALFAVMWKKARKTGSLRSFAKAS